MLQPKRKIKHSQGAVPLSSIISRAIKDSAHAQMNAAKTMKDYMLQEIMFGQNKDLRTLCFTYTVDGEQRILKMPLATVVPASFIQIKEVEIDFHVNVDDKRAWVRLDQSRITSTSGENEHKPQISKGLGVHVKIKGKNTEMSGGMARVLQLTSTTGTSVTSLD